VFSALMKPGDTFMGLDLAAGGHLTHGSPANHVRQVVQGRVLRVRAGRPDRSTWRRSRLAHEHKPKVIIAGGSAYARHWDFARFREIADEVGAYFMVDMAHFAGLSPAASHPSPVPARPCRHHHDAQDPARPARRHDPHQRRGAGKKFNSAVFPGLQGGPLMHVIAAKAVAFGEALKPEFKLYARAVVDNAKALADTMLKEQGLRHRHRRHRQPPDAGRPAPKEAHRQGGRSRARPRPHHLQQERRALRSREADAMTTSGIRLGTPAATSRGFGVGRVQARRRAQAQRRKVAYVRYASVYKDFRHTGDFARFLGDEGLDES
jgi:glycine hydroxymethyltransferase